MLTILSYRVIEEINTIQLNEKLLKCALFCVYISFENACFCFSTYFVPYYTIEINSRFVLTAFNYCSLYITINVIVT